MILNLLQNPQSSIDSNREIATTHTKRGNTLKTFFETLFGKKDLL